MSAVTTLTNQQIATSYVQLLHTGDSDGLGSTPLVIYDGDGTASGMSLGTGGISFADSKIIKLGTGNDLQIYHDGSNSFITNSTGALKLATETSGIAVTIGHSTSETTIGDNLTITGNASVGGNLTVTGTTTFNGGTITLGDATSDTIAFGGTITGSLVFEGSSDDANEITLSPGNPDADRTVTLPNATDTLVGLATSDTLTNKTIDVDNNTLSNVEVDNLKSGVLDTDISSVSGSDDTLASAKAIKTYVDAQVTAQDLDATTDSGTIAIDLDSETLTIAGGEGIDTSASSNTITIAGEDASTSNKGVASFSSDNFAVSSGAVTIKDNGVILATETTGDYVQNITGGTGIDSTGATSGENIAHTLSIDLNELTTETTIADDDFIAMVDATDSGSGKITFENLEDAIFASVSGDIQIAEDGTATIQANSVALSTDTTGNYIATISGTSNEIEVSGSGSEGATATIGLQDDVTIAGNLTVNGTTTTIDTTNLVVEDPLIKLAKNNNSADSVDIGFYGLYDTSGSTDLYAGLFRDANDSGKFKLFADLQAEPTTTVNTSGTGYATGTLVANIEGNVTGTIQTASQTNITSVGTLGTGAISSGFGNIDIGSSNLTATGTISLGGTSFNDNDLTNIGDISADSISSDGSTFNIAMDDNQAGAFTIKESSNSYITLDTTDSSEKIQFHKSLDIDATSDFGSNAMTNVNIDSGTIDGTDVTVGSGKTLDVSGGTLTLANDQISGDKVSGGTIGSTTITALAGDLSLGDNAITNVGDVSLDSISADNNTMDITLTDNQATALEIKESTNSYLTFVTTDSGEKITLGKKLEAGSVEIEGSAFDIDGGDIATAVTVGGSDTITEFVQDIAGGMFSGNTETGITATYQDGDNNIDLAINASQTTITSLLATDIKIGEDDETKIDFETADEIHFYANNVEQVYLADNIFGPQSDSDVDLGSTSVRWKDAYIDTITTTGALTVGGNGIIGDGSDIDPDSSGSGQLKIDGNGYTGYVALNGTAMNIGHNSSARNLVFQTNETTRMTIDNSDAITIGQGMNIGTLHADVNLGTSATEVFDLTNTAPANNTGDGIYLFNAVRRGGSYSTRFTGIIGVDNGGIAVVDTIENNGFTISVAGMVIKAVDSSGSAINISATLQPLAIGD